MRMYKLNLCDTRKNGSKHKPAGAMAQQYAVHKNVVSTEIVLQQKRDRLAQLSPRSHCGMVRGYQASART